LAAQLMGEMKQKIKVLELEPSSGGAFEVHVDGKEVYSKLKTGKFPDEARLVAEITGRA
jgi:selT/selW/selH-like putative selenoprotein